LVIEGWSTTVSWKKKENRFGFFGLVDYKDLIKIGQYSWVLAYRNNRIVRKVFNAKADKKDRPGFIAASIWMPRRSDVPCAYGVTWTIQKELT
jgi:hypothetical protein